MRSDFGWPLSYVGYLTTAIQAGFITGTFCFALLGISDRHSPSRVFFVSSLIAAAANLIPLLEPSSFGLSLTGRTLTGFFLAGVYPVGMKIASDWSSKGLGLWLGSLVGALVIGTAFPHLLNSIVPVGDAASVLTTVSTLAAAGGFLVLLFVADGPFRKKGNGFHFYGVIGAFKTPAFRRAALGYFGHMWELYAMWAFIPSFLAAFNAAAGLQYSVSLLSFIVIAFGGIGCIAGGMISTRTGSAIVARTMLITSGVCCLLSFLVFETGFNVLFPFLCVWGFSIAADSPQFSALVATSAAAEYRGSAITMVTCIGFFISIVSIGVLNYFQHWLEYQYLFLLLVPGPVVGVIMMSERK